MTTRSRGVAPAAYAFVFAYGSLINPSSVRRTLPQVDLRRCAPAYCQGMRRTLGVAFPNDGSQTDKWYADDAGHRPPRILFANLEPRADTRANGVLIPVTPADVSLLLDRERRYDLTDITQRITLWSGACPGLPVATFVGHTEFTRPVDVAAGMVPAAYLESLRTGARFWDRDYPGFEDAFLESTLEPPRDRIRSLQRFDAPA